MGSYKAYIVASVLCVTANADVHFEHFKVLSRSTGDPDFTNPWTFDSPHDPYEFAGSDSRPSYTSFSRGGEEGMPDYFRAASTKKVPRENKHFKKVVSPFYTITDSDSEKYKDFVFKSGVPYCEEVKEKTKRDGKGSNVCYKCKNPKSGAIYEKCTYVSDPSAESGSSRVEDFAAPPFSFRGRRSNSDSEASPSNFKHGSDYDRHENPYRFSDDVFSGMTQNEPIQYKNNDEQCEKAVKGSMVCMVCKDTKTNGKYEQCSYVRQPEDKAYAYSKSRSYKDPDAGRDGGLEDEESRRVDREYPEPKPVEERQEQENRSSEEESSGEETSSNCKEVQKDSETCMVCKDPKTGGNYEKCSRAYQPNDKVYKFSKSKSFGYPSSEYSYPKHEQSSNYGDAFSKGSSSYPREYSDYKADYSIPEDLYSKIYKASSGSHYGDDKFSSGYRRNPSDEPKSSAYKDSSQDYAKSESEARASKIDPTNCEKVHKDSMVCDVCKDPKTGANSEKCTYVYKPTEKLYSYSKSSSFGNPKDTEGKASQEASEKSKESERSDSSSGKSESEPEEKKVLQAESDTRREFREAPTTSTETTSEPSEDSTGKKSEAVPKKPDTDFYDTMKKKAEIEKFLQEFQKEDRSNCKKIMRDKMTCYQCVDEKGVQKEECAFIRAEEPDKDKISYHEMKEYQVDPVKKVPRSVKVDKKGRTRNYVHLEPAASASENSYERQEKPVKEDVDETRYVENLEEAGPYEYTEETRPVFDKVLGLTLPAYMLARSEHEAEFDEVASSSRS